MSRLNLLVLLSAILLLGVTSRAQAAPPHESLVPATTKGYLSVPDVDALRERWNATQLGEMVKDPVMKPFVEDLQRQLANRLNQAGIRLGLKMEDLEDVYGGEVSVAAIQPGGKADQHALVLISDITGHRKQADELIAKISADFAKQNATKATVTLSGVSGLQFTLPRKRGEVTASQAFYFIHDDRLIAADHKQVVTDILGRFKGDSPDSLATVESFLETQKRVKKAHQDATYHIAWFIEPFGYTDYVRASSDGPKKRGTDLLQVLRNQGFTAVQGLGGVIALADGSHEILHRTSIYAPAVKRKADDKGTDKYELAARMLDFPNAKPLAPQLWMPNGVANYISFNWKLSKAFESARTMVNELAGAKEDEDLFEDIVRSIATDPMGPQIDLRKDLIQHLRDRVTVASDYKLPITPQSERLLFAIELKDAKAVAETVDKAMRADPDARKRMIDGHVVWEILNEAPADVVELQVQSPFGPGGLDEEPIEDDEPAGPLGGELMTNLAITVAEGHLLVATHIDFIANVLKTAKERGSLSEAPDHQRVVQALEKLGSDTDSFQVFTRTDQAYRPTYELLRTGKMPESETLLGKFLNRTMGPDEKGVLRDQQIDGTKMPQFELVQKYLGPGGLYVTSEEQGWVITGCLLRRE